MSLIKITLVSGDTAEFVFDERSQLTVESTVTPEPGVTRREARSWTEIAAVELVAGDPATGAVDLAADDTGLTSPETAVFVAKGLPLADAAAHVEKALARFPGDADLLQMQADIHEAVSSGAETFTTTVGDPPAEEQPAVEEAPVVEADPATLETPAAAIDHATTLPIDEAQTHIEAALAKFPDDPDLVAAQGEIAAIIAADQNQS